jgi:hypothetical protein
MPTQPDSLLAMAALAGALASSPTIGAERMPTCVGAEHRSFDFWLGEWRVMVDGALAGHNRIESILSGCALMETWQGAKGGRGRSLNAYDATRGVWHQTWVDAHGEILILEGGWRDGAMRLEGAHRASVTAAPVRARITWTPNADGSVRQLWETSADGGRRWRVEFDGRYERVKRSR